jgi:hypothetical protein
MEKDSNIFIPKYLQIPIHHKIGVSKDPLEIEYPLVLPIGKYRCVEVTRIISGSSHFLSFNTGIKSDKIDVEFRTLTSSVSYSIKVPFNSILSESNRRSFRFFVDENFKDDSIGKEVIFILEFHYV